MSPIRPTQKPAPTAAQNPALKPARGLPRLRPWRAALLGCALAAGLGPRPTSAAQLPLPETPFAYIVVRQDLRGFLREFAAWAGVPLDLHRAVQGVVSGPLPDLPPHALLDRITAENSLYWWFDGAALRIGPTSEMTTATLPLPPEHAEAAAETLARLGVLDARFPLRLEPELGMAAATGPEPYVRKVMQALTAAAGAEAGRPEAGETTVRVLRGGRMVEVTTPAARGASR